MMGTASTLPCFSCGEPAIEGTTGGPDYECPACGARRGFTRLPLVILCGAPASGKSTLINAAISCESRPQAVYLDGDYLRELFKDRDQDDFVGYWSLLAAVLHRNGRPLVFCGAIHPGSFSGHARSGYFSAIIYIAAVCPVDEHDRRLAARGYSEEIRQIYREWNRRLYEGEYEAEYLRVETGGGQTILESTGEFLAILRDRL